MQRLFFSVLSLVLVSNFNCTAQRSMDDVVIKTTKVSDQVYMLEGRGGNIGVSAGEDGIFIIDDQFAPLTEKILAAIGKISSKELKYLVNTHWHGDHTGGNENMAEAGLTIMAHDNVRKRLEETPQRDGSMRSKTALPVITFNDELSVFMNGEKVAIYHVEHAHTDGDVILYFTESNVLHTGDTYFKARYPYIDLNSGGSVDGIINAVKKTLEKINNDTKIIPGHGTLSNKAEYEDYLKMLEDLKSNVIDAINAGKSEEEITKDSTITTTYDALKYGDYFINSERIRSIFYKSLKN